MARAPFRMEEQDFEKLVDRVYKEVKRRLDGPYINDTEPNRKIPDSFDGWVKKGLDLYNDYIAEGLNTTFEVKGNDGKTEAFKIFVWFKAETYVTEFFYEAEPDEVLLAKMNHLKSEVRFKSGLYK